MSTIPMKMQCSGCSAVGIVTDQYSDTCGSCSISGCWTTYTEPDNANVEAHLFKIADQLEDIKFALDKKPALSNGQSKRLLNREEFIDNYHWTPQQVVDAFASLTNNDIAQLAHNFGLEKTEPITWPSRICRELARLEVPYDMWVTSGGSRCIPVNELDDYHIVNILNYMPGLLEGGTVTAKEQVRRDHRFRCVILEAERRKLRIPTMYKVVMKLLTKQQREDLAAVREHATEILANRNATEWYDELPPQEVDIMTTIKETTKEIGGAMKEGAAIATVGMSIDKAIQKIADKYGDQMPWLRTEKGKLALKAVIPSMAVYGVDLAGENFPFPGKDNIRKVGLHGAKAAGYDAAVQVFGLFFEMFGPIFGEMFTSWNKVADQIPDKGEEPVDFKAEKEKLAEREAAERKTADA